PQAPARDPGTRATVLVALATTAASAAPSGDSAASSAGKVSRVPPPAVELTAPAASAAKQSQISSQDKFTLSAFDTKPGRRDENKDGLLSSLLPHPFLIRGCDTPACKHGCE